MTLTAMPRRRALALAGLALLSWSPAIGAAADAGPDPDEAAIFVREFADRAIAMLADPGASQAKRADALRDLLRTGFDLDVTGRLVLGRYWRQASARQREAYRQLFEDYVVAIYGRRLGEYSGETLEVRGARLEGERDAIVRSRAQTSDGRPPVGLDWRLRRSEDGWRIIDVIVEGVSLAITHRSEFAAVIGREGGIDGLLRALRNKTTAGNGQVARKPEATETRT
jgi:phospholipid transport system substrate-binding protein